MFACLTGAPTITNGALVIIAATNSRRSTCEDKKEGHFAISRLLEPCRTDTMRTKVV